MVQTDPMTPWAMPNNALIMKTLAGIFWEGCDLHQLQPIPAFRSKAAVADLIRRQISLQVDGLSRASITVDSITGSGTSAGGENHVEYKPARSQRSVSGHQVAVA